MKKSRPSGAHHKKAAHHMAKAAHHHEQARHHMSKAHEAKERTPVGRRKMSKK